MQQVFLKKAKRGFTLIEVLVALMLFSMIVAPFIVAPMRSLKTCRNKLIESELQRYDTLITAKLQKKANAKALDVKITKSHLEPIVINLEPLGKFKYSVHYTQRSRQGKLSDTALCKIKLYFTPTSKYLPKPKPYLHSFIVKSEG
jgi:prepilin-type N-terminal cleavage/methylation domain-containing protein